MVVFFSFILLCSIKSVQFSSVQLVGRQKAHRSVKLSDEVLVWLSVWSEVQIVCIWSS